jgi:aryl-alcohol dehydrogenase-like predicted oxidoreductase
MMKYTNLGRTGLKVSRLCLGTMNFGNVNDEKESFKIMDAALDAGINFFDTANNYGKAIHQEGNTEKIIGRWFAQGGGRREKVVLATKVHEEMHDPNDGPNSPSGLSLYKIRRHLDASLKRLQTGHVEIYYMHHIDRNVTWDEIWDAFQPLVQQGRIDYIASSNFAGWNIAMAQAEAKARHILGLVCEQHLYNLLCRLPELELLPSAKAHGLGVVAWSPLQQGLLARNALTQTNTVRTAHQKAQLEKCRKQLETFGQLCKELGEHEDNVALAWLLANPAVTAPIIGPRTLEQFESSLKALDVVLSPDVMKKLNEIFPGPGGQAPEAYAW